MGPFTLFGTHWLRCCLSVLPQHLVPTHLSSLRVEVVCSLVCLPQWSVKGVSLWTGPSTCLLLSAHRLRDSISDNHPKLFQTDYYCCDYYYCCERTSRQQSKQVHFKANNSLVLIHKAWAYPILSCDWENLCSKNSISCNIPSFWQGAAETMKTKAGPSTGSLQNFGARRFNNFQQELAHDSGQTSLWNKDFKVKTGFY